MDRHDCRVGMNVSFHHKGVTWYGKITKINPKNMKVTTHHPHVSRYNVHPIHLTDESGSSTAPTVKSVPAASLVVYFRGNVVKCPSLGADLYVVLNGGREGLYNLAKLGGNGGLYYTDISASLIEQVNFELAGV